MKLRVLSLIIICLAMLAHADHDQLTAQTTAKEMPNIGLASWYAEFSPGIRKTTANMELFDDSELTCAMWDVPFGTIIKVTNLENNKTVIVRVNDRGPAKRLVRNGRIIDLTQAAFAKIADLGEGLIQVKVEIANPGERGEL